MWQFFSAMGDFGNPLQMQTRAGRSQRVHMGRLPFCGSLLVSSCTGFGSVESSFCTEGFAGVSSVGSAGEDMVRLGNELAS
jgi:hypothetical protein